MKRNHWDRLVDVSKVGSKRKRTYNIPATFHCDVTLHSLIGQQMLPRRVEAADGTAEFVPEIFSELHVETIRLIATDPYLLKNRDMMKWWGGRHTQCSEVWAVLKFLEQCSVGVNTDLYRRAKIIWDELKKKEQHISDQTIESHYLKIQTDYPFASIQDASRFAHQRMWSHPNQKPVISWEDGWLDGPTTLCEATGVKGEASVWTRCRDARMLTLNEQMQNLYFLRCLRRVYNLVHANYSCYAEKRNSEYKVLFMRLDAWIEPLDE